MGSAYEGDLPSNETLLLAEYDLGRKFQTSHPPNLKVVLMVYNGCTLNVI